MSIKPLGNRALVKAIEEKTAIEKAGLVLPDSVENKDKPMKYKVVALGDGSDLAELGLADGDVVIINKYAGSATKFEDIEYKIVTCGDIQAKVV